MAFKTIPSTVFEHWSKFPAELWRWPNFTPQEMACKGDNRLLLHGPSMDRLQALRTRLGAAMVIHSAYRTREYNDRVGGAAGSMHLAARAYDVSMGNHDPHEFEAAARACGFTGFGFYPAQGFMHIDTGPGRWWGTRWPFGDDDHLAPEPRPRQLAGAEAETARAEIVKGLQQIFGKSGSALKNKQRRAS